MIPCILGVYLVDRFNFILKYTYIILPKLTSPRSTPKVVCPEVSISDIFAAQTEVTPTPKLRSKLRPPKHPGLFLHDLPRLTYVFM
jgi:hypothetical protein